MSDFVKGILAHEKTEKDKREAEGEREKKAFQQRKDELSLEQVKVLRFLQNDLDGHLGFKVVLCGPDSWGTIAELRWNGYIYYVSIRRERYTFRGSDESPEVEGWEMVYLLEVCRGATGSACVKGRSLQDFKKYLAEWIVDVRMGKGRY